jgi:hypothetical protein
MTRPRASTVLRRFLDGASIYEIVNRLRIESRMSVPTGYDYVERCIRRGLRGEVRIPATRRQQRSKP